VSPPGHVERPVILCSAEIETKAVPPENMGVELVGHHHHDPGNNYPWDNGWGQYHKPTTSGSVSPPGQWRGIMA
jgi:hypothetical protein